MSVLTGYKRVKNYLLTSNGFKLLSRWTHAGSVEFDDHKTAQEKLGDINGLVKTYDDMASATDPSLAVSATAAKGINDKLLKFVYKDTDAFKLNVIVGAFKDYVKSAPVGMTMATTGTRTAGAPFNAGQLTLFKNSLSEGLGLFIGQDGCLYVVGLYNNEVRWTKIVGVPVN